MIYCAWWMHVPHLVPPKCSVTMTFRLMILITTRIAYLHAGRSHFDILSGTLRTLLLEIRKRVFSRGRMHCNETIIHATSYLGRTESPTVQRIRFA